MRFSPRRRTQPARPFDSLLSLQTAVRGKVHGVGRAGAAGCFSRCVAGVHDASLFFFAARRLSERFRIFRRALECALIFSLKAWMTHWLSA